MAETKQDERLTEPQAAPEEELKQAPEEAPEEAPQEGSEEQPEEPKKAPKQRNILLPVLIVLLILLGISEAVFWGYFGLSVYARSLSRERYEQQQKALAEEQASKGIRGGSSYSPNLKVENGTVTWEREKREYAGTNQPTNTSTAIWREDGLRLAWLPVFRIPYLLAEPKEEPPAAQPEQTAPAGQTGQTVPATA